MAQDNRFAKKFLWVLVAIALSVSISTGVVVGQSIIYHGNTDSHIFHRPTCRYYDCKNCLAEFESREDAIDSGYRPCKKCKP